MKIILSIVITLLLFGLGFGLYMLIPFKKKKNQLIVTIVGVAIAVIMIFIPASFICSIELPFFSMNANEIITKVLYSSEEYEILAKSVGEFEPGIMKLAQAVVKSSVVFVIEGIYLMFASFITTMIYLFKKKKKDQKKRVGGALFANLGCLVLSLSFLFVPLYTVSKIYVNLNTALGIGKDSLYNKYEGFKKYAPIIDLIDTVSVVADTDFMIADIPLWAADSFSLGAASQLTEDLNSVDLVIYHFEEAGIQVVFNKGFSFLNTTPETFDFNEMNSVVGLALVSEVYDDVALMFLNDILTYVENIIKVNTGKSNVNLQYTLDEFKAQYTQIIDILNFVMEFDLLNRLDSYFSLSGSLSDKIKDIASVAQTIIGDTKNRHRALALLDYPLVKKVISYYVEEDMGLLDVAEKLIQAIRTCLDIFSALDQWKDKFETTEMYDIALKFMKDKGVVAR